MAQRCTDRISMGLCAMFSSFQMAILRMGRSISIIMTGPPALAFLPAVCLSAFWFGGEGALLICAAAIPIIYLGLGALRGSTSQLLLAREGSPGVLQRRAFEELVDQIFTYTEEVGWKSAVFCFEIEDFAELARRYGTSAADHVRTKTGERLISALRDKDSTAEFGPATFGVCLDPVRHLDLELCIQMAARLQRTVEEPILVDGTVIYVSVCAGFCQHARSPQKKGDAWLQAAITALSEAVRHGPSGIRAFSDRMLPPTEHSAALVDEVAHALENGQITPWFQPQLSTDTGQISGFEALARWSHPTRGVLLPADFLPALEQADLLERLAEIMIFHSFAALKGWDAAGANVP
jgi:diguanylate cyclase (GGDEF)-like protein